MRPMTYGLVTLLLSACGQLTVGDDDLPDPPPAAACVEQIVEPNAGYVIARVLRSYDSVDKPIDERLTDLHPDHQMRAPCYDFSTGYTRYVQTWTYDDAGRTVAERFNDLGDGAGCGGDRPASAREKAWVFDTRGLLLAERGRYATEGETPRIEETTNSYDANGFLLSSVFSGAGNSSTSTWSYAPGGKPLSLELVYTNNVGDRFLSTKLWEYDAGALLREVDNQSRPLDGSDGFFRAEARMYDRAGKVIEERIDHHEYPPGSTSGPYGADGVFDSHYLFAYDGAGARTRETLIHDFMGGVVDQDISWELDAQGRIVREIRTKPASSAYGLYFAKEYAYGPAGIVSAKGFNSDGSVGWEVQFVYDGAGRQVRTRLSTDGTTFATLSETEYEYDDAGRVIRARTDSDGNGTSDDERSYAYECGVEFTSPLGRNVQAP